MADAAIGTDLAQPLDRLLALSAQVAFDLEIGVDVVAELRDLTIGEVAHLRVQREAKRRGDFARLGAADAEDVREGDLEALLTGKVYSCDACHYPCLCLCRGFVQMTMVRPLRRITRHRSHMGFTDARTFIRALLLGTRARLKSGTEQTNRAF